MTGDPWFLVEILAGHERTLVVGRWRTSGNAGFGAMKKAYYKRTEPDGATVIIKKLPPCPRRLASVEYTRRLRKQFGAI